MDVFRSLEIETIGSCNRSCVTCLRQTHPAGSSTHATRFPLTSTAGEGAKMPAVTFHSIVAQAVDMGFTGRVCLSHYNEPLLDDRLASFGACVQGKPEIAGPLTFCTNADLMTEERATECGGIFDCVVVALYMGADRRAAREAELRAMFSEAELRFVDPAHGITHFSPLPGLAVAIEKHCQRPCTHYNDHLFIAHDGTVLHCCDDYAGHFDLGNVNERSISDIWSSQRYAELVDRLSRPGGRLEDPHCAICPRVG